MGVFDTTPFNSNYQYFNLKQKTMPNGLGMGGQLEYFGLWIDSEFGQVGKNIGKDIKKEPKGANSSNLLHVSFPSPWPARGKDQEAGGEAALRKL